MYKLSMCVALLVGGTFGIPIKDELMFEGQGDTATVESTVREARAAPNHIGDLIQPGVKDAFLYVYGDAENEDGDLHGYSKKMDDKGQDGYKHFDSFHKRDGDKFGYEKHSEFGQANKVNIDNENKKGLELAHFEAEGGKDEKDKDEEDGDETRNSYAVTEELHEDKKQPAKKAESEYGLGDGEGGSYYEESSSSEGDGEAETEDEGGESEGESDDEGEAESRESAEGDGGDGENDEYEESEESEEGEEESEY